MDVATGAECSAVIGDPGGVSSPSFGDVKSVAVGSDGSMALVVKAEDDSEVIGYAPNLPQALGSPRPLFTMDSGDVMPSSLTLAGGAVTWSTRSGMSGAVNVNG